MWGISTDVLSTTHPICAEQILNSEQAETLFDGISYGKGSSFLKCLYKLVGDNTMKEGLHKYFDDFQW